MAIKTDKLCLAWTGDYESLKQFVMESLKLDGIWSQPGGDKKVFNAEDCLISWRKNNKLLFIEGKREIQVKKEVCECLFGETTEVRVHSSDSPDISAVIEDLRVGQLVNGEAIQALSQSIIHINAVLSQVQVSKDKSVEFLNEVKSYNSAETINCYDKNANQAHVCESPEVELCKSVVLEQTATSVEDNRNNNSTSLTVTLGVDETLSEDIRNDSSTSVIPPLSVVESVPVGNYDKILINEDSSSLLNTQSPTNIDGEFKGVERRRNKIKHFFLSGISEDTNENQIMSYLNKRNIKPTRVSVFKSRRKGSNSAKVSIPSSATPMLENENFWPDFVKCKPWRKKPKKYETYV